MGAYATSLMIAIPGFILLMIIEGIVDWQKGKKRVNAMDTISSLSSGVTNLIRTSLKLIVVIVGYDVMVNYLAVTKIESTWGIYLAAFIALDFAGYWNHRLNHSVNFFWNSHRIHHSSEEFNLPCALRQSISGIFNIGVLFLLPAALLGVPEEVIGAIAPAHLFLQFWYHTQYIPKLGFLEYIIITPSQHRVHHAINPEYIDKNLGEIFSIWDRVFGTFQAEMDEVPPVYGITMPARTWNPVKINFQHLWLLMQDAWHTKNVWDKFRIWFMPTGWRPADVRDKYPVAKIDDVYAFDKYTTNATNQLIAWSWYNYIFCLFLTLYMFYSFIDIGYENVLLYSGILFLSVYGFTDLMDQSKYAFWVELSRSLIAIITLVVMNGWFGIGKVGTYIVLFYFVTVPIGAYFLSMKKEENDTQVILDS